MKILIISIVFFVLGIILFTIEPRFQDYEIHVYFIALGLTAGGLIGVGIFFVLGQFMRQSEFYQNTILVKLVITRRLKLKRNYDD